MKTRQIVCLACKEDFESRNIRQKYCSQRCRGRAYYNGLRVGQVRQDVAIEAPKPPPWPAHEVPVAIVAHPSRYAMATQLADDVDAEALCVDVHSSGTEFNHIRALRWLAGGRCPWSVVIEDDAIPLRTFRRQLHSVLRACPTPICSLYLGRSRPPHWQGEIAKAIAPLDSDPHYLLADALLHGVGYAVHTELLPDMIGAVTLLTRKHPIDEAITMWARDRGHKVSYARPSILDHRDGPTTYAGHPDGQLRTDLRKAWMFDCRKEWKNLIAEIGTPPNG